jgi:putative hemolysin
VRREQFRPLFFPSRAKDIVPPVATDVLQAEVDRLADLRINGQGEFDLYLAPSDRIPNLLREIGRQREVTFRAIGEGTNKAIDLDEFDLYYDHLFLWDREKQRLAGSYRIGDGKRIVRRYGKRGFYTHTLFRMDRGMEKVLGQAFELGRSFVPQEYQRHRLPLFMLWRGLLIHILHNPDHRYLIGPVSISGSYSRLSRSLIMEFVQQHYYDEELAGLVRPRNRFKVTMDKADSDALLELAADLKKLDQLIADVEPKGFTVPVLLKKYLLLNARIIGFNRDPRFNDALDGLMVLDLTKVPDRVIEDLQKGMEAPS